VIIATADANIGMGGPAMIEGAGLGVFGPEEIGPRDEQVANGVVDVAVTDEAEAVAVARRYLSYFHGRAAPESRHHADQQQLRSLVPEDRRRAYDIRPVLATLADTGSVLELRAGFGTTMITALVRIDGHPLGVVANDPMQKSGAIDADGADKAARFLQLCDAFDLPVLFLCDTPGIMVGPDAERSALVRHASRLFVVGANLDVPTATIVLRKGYGLGSMAMAAGGFKAPLFCVAWPTGEFGGMGLEGAVRLGYRRELAAAGDPAEQERLFQEKLAALYEVGRALSAATAFEIDDVIDPADSRRWITGVLLAGEVPAPRQGKKRPFVDPW
jgi:acetyl-CoA carboxylase carboxyltransferase component